MISLIAALAAGMVQQTPAPTWTIGGPPYDVGTEVPAKKPPSATCGGDNSCPPPRFFTGVTTYAYRAFYEVRTMPGYSPPISWGSALGAARTDPVVFCRYLSLISDMTDAGLIQTKAPDTVIFDHDQLTCPRDGKTAPFWSKSK